MTYVSKFDPHPICFESKVLVIILLDIRRCLDPLFSKLLGSKAQLPALRRSFQRGSG